MPLRKNIEEPILISTLLDNCGTPKHVDKLLTYMATLHLKFIDDCDHVVKKSYKVKTIKDVYNYLSPCFSGDYYIKCKETTSCTQYASGRKKITAFVTKYGQDYSITEFENISI